MSKIDLDALEQALLLAQQASCTCLTKTHETAYHDDSCRYKKLVFIEDGVHELIRRLREAERDAERLNWIEADMQENEPVSIEFRDGKFRFPYLVSGAGGLGGGVGEANFDSLREAIDVAMSQESNNG